MLTIPFTFDNFFGWKVFVTIPDVSDNYSPTVKEIKQAIYQKYYPLLHKIKSFEDIVITDYIEEVTNDTLIETMTSIKCSSKFETPLFTLFRYDIY